MHKKKIRCVNALRMRQNIILQPTEHTSVSSNIYSKVGD